MFVCENGGFRQDEFMGKILQGFLAGIFYNASNNPASARRALHNASNYSFFTAIQPFWCPALIAAWPTSDVNLIHLHRRSLQLHVRFGQQRTKLLKHSPSSFVGDSGFALDLFSRNSAARRSHQVHSVIPETQRRGALLENRASHRRDLRTAVVA